MDYSNVTQATLRMPKPLSKGMQQSIMRDIDTPIVVPEINADLPIESVSPEDWIPNPKTAAALGSIALKNVWKQFFKGSPEEYNQVVQALRKSAPKQEAQLRPLNSWDDLLTTEAKTPRKAWQLGAYTQPVDFSGKALRVQASPDLDLGNSYTKQWLGTHFDLSGGAQIPDIISAQKRLAPVQLPEQYLHQGIIQPESKGLIVPDFYANMPGLNYWRQVTNADKPHTAKSLVEALRNKNIDWIAYQNQVEGHVPKTKPQYPAMEGNKLEPKYFGDLQLSNPGITVLNPKIFTPE